MDPTFFYLSISHTSVLHKVEGTQYKICCVSKHGYRCAAVEPLFPLPTCPCTKTLTVYRKYVVCQNMITVVLLWQPAVILLWKKRVSYTYCTVKFASGQSYVCTTSGFAGLLWSFCEHTITVFVSQLISCLTATCQYPSFYHLSPACRPENAHGNSHLATTSHTLRTYLCIEP